MFQTLDSNWQFVSKLVESQCKCLIAWEWQWRLAFKLQLKLSVKVRSCLIAFSKISTLLAVDRCTKESEPPKSRILHPLTDLTTLFCCFVPTQRKNSSINKSYILVLLLSARGLKNRQTVPNLNFCPKISTKGKTQFDRRFWIFKLPTRLKFSIYGARQN